MSVATAPQRDQEPRSVHDLDLARQRYSLLLAGVGGQGVLTAAKILGVAANSVGIRVAVGQLHGMTQRGGSVECPIIFGASRSCFITRRADVVVAFEAIEALRAARVMGPQTRVLINRGIIVPFETTRVAGSLPPVDDVLADISGITTHVIDVDGFEMLRSVGERRTLNIMLLGIISAMNVLPFSHDVLWEAVMRLAPGRFAEVNRRAFDVGLEWGRNL